MTTNLPVVKLDKGIHVMHLFYRIDRERWTVVAPVRVFADQADLVAAFGAGELDGDMIAVVRFQGPRANGMPELHNMTSALGVLQDRGFKVALVTDGRMSGASGKVPAAIHVTPEAHGGGPLARLRDGDVIRLCAEHGIEVVRSGFVHRQEERTRLEHQLAGAGVDLAAVARRRGEPQA